MSKIIKEKAPKTKGEPPIYRDSPQGIGCKVAASWSFEEKIRIPNVNVQRKSKAQMTN
jgi:hypothetical protein